MNQTKSEPERLGLAGPGEFPLYTVIRDFAAVKNETKIIAATQGIMAELRKRKCFPPGWADNLGGRKKLSTSLQVAAWDWDELNLAPADDEKASEAFLTAAIEELARTVK